jgi:hypothetical protein
MQKTNSRNRKVPKSASNAGHPLKNGPPAESVKRAAEVFKQFSLSRFAKGGRPPNFADSPDEAKALHRKLMGDRLADLAREASVNRRISIALTPKTLKRIVPSFGTDGQTVQTQEIISLLSTHLRSRQFTVTGNPTLKRVALQKEIDQIFDRIKDGTK